MKNLINIWNPVTGNSKVTLKELRELICDRRFNSLNPLGKRKHGVKTTTTDKSLKQVAAHYCSFEIRKFDYKKAIEVYNIGGCQIASIIK